MQEPLVQTQVLPYLRQIRAQGIEVNLLTFESNQRHIWSSEDGRGWRARLQVEGIRWFSLPYHKKPSLPATLYDIAVGAWTASRLMRRYGIPVLHARSHVAAAIGMLAKINRGDRAGRPYLIFDIRGFMPEEYVDAGLWLVNGYLYRWTKLVERQLFMAADGFVVLTERARDILFPGCLDTDRLGRPVEVIPCCVDLERFQKADSSSKEEVRKELGLTGRHVLVYVGALGGWYLTDKIAEFLATAHQQNKSTFSMILTQSPPGMITEPLRKLGVVEKDYLVCQVSPEEVPRYLKAADIALSFIKPCYSKLASSPTKIAEYLASGLLVICNAGIGDVDKILEEDRVGVILQEFNREAYSQALHMAEELLQDDGISDRCRASARKHFDLETVGGVRYRRLYDRLLERKEHE
ncbi:MAG: glycosyltransferase, partial [Nitrososphaera sp.]|nr:glycosyltransferase [Nitrososphaera sp.]